MKIKDIANALHLSVSTVSKALNGAFDVSAETKAEVLEYAKQNGYKSKDERLFMFNVTVQNHGPFDFPAENFEYKTDIVSEDLQSTEQYFSCLKYSDEALEYLISYFENYNEPIAVVFFGDHQAKLDGKFYEQLYSKPIEELTEEEQKQKYIVPYFIWTNYNVDFSSPSRSISANYLSPHVLDLLGFPQTSYQKYLNTLSQTYPIITSQGISIDGYHYSSVLPDISKYQHLAYNLLFDQKHLWNQLHCINLD